MSDGESDLGDECGLLLGLVVATSASDQILGLALDGLGCVELLWSCLLMDAEQLCGELLDLLDMAMGLNEECERLFKFSWLLERDAALATAALNIIIDIILASSWL